MSVAERVRVRETADDEGQRLLRGIRRGTGSVVTRRRAQTVLLSAQVTPGAKIAGVTFTSADRVREVIHDFNADGFEVLYPKYKGGRPRTFTLPERRESKKIAKSRPAEHGLPPSGRRGGRFRGAWPCLDLIVVVRASGNRPPAAPWAGDDGSDR